MLMKQNIRKEGMVGPLVASTPLVMEGDGIDWDPMAYGPTET